MNISGEDLWFWLAIVGAIIVKLVTADQFSWWRSVVTVVAAVFAAFFFTDPALDFLNLNPEIYRTPMAAVIALTGEGAMKFLVVSAGHPQKLVDLWRGLGGRK